MARDPRTRAAARNAADDEALSLAEDAPPAQKAGDDLADTAVEVEIPPEETLAPPQGPKQDAWTKQFGGEADPEAGVYRVADKRFLLSVITKSPLTLLISSLLWFLAGATLLILALILQDDYYTYPAPALVPFAWFMCWRTWRKWKGRAMFADRLVETLDGPEVPESSGAR